MRISSLALSCAMICALTFGTAGTAAAQEKLVWSDEFNGPAQSAPDPKNWAYDGGSHRWGNDELETYCRHASSEAPCDPKAVNDYVGGDGYLHIVAHKAASGAYTSARLKSEGLHSFLYGRIEARIKMPAGQGMWPAFWMLGDNIATAKWPACGEIDIMESVGKAPTMNYGSIHGTGFIGSSITTGYPLPNGGKFADAFHTFGILWSPREMKFYVDDPSNVYATYTPSSLPAGAVWPFDAQKFFFILNVAVGGQWPGSPDATTVFPQEMLVDYVRVYQEPAPAKAAAPSRQK